MENNIKCGVQILLSEPDDFLKIKETLTRIGIKSAKNNTLYQSCCILHKRGIYYIMHYKEMFVLDNKENNMSDDDYARRNTITRLLEQWNMCQVHDKKEIENSIPISEITIIPYKEKKNWTLVSKYSVGSRK